MNISCDVKTLTEAVNNVSLAVSQRSTLPALEGILLKGTENGLTLTGYNLEIGIKKTIDIHIREAGAVVLNGRLFLDILRKLESETIEIKTDEKMLTQIESGQAQFTILGMDPDEFPDIPTFEEGKSFSIADSVLKNMISHTIFAVSQTDQNPILTGTLFEIQGGCLSLVSVDGFRLALRKEKVNVEDTFSFVVPGKTLSDIVKLLSEEEERTTRVSVGNKHIIFEIDGYHVISRLLEGNFIDYRSVIPKGSLTSVKINKKEFLSCIERASIIINDRAKNPIKCEINKEYIKINSESTMGKVNDKIYAEINGEDVKIGFNNRYMLDALKNTEDEEFSMEFNGPLSPIKLVPYGEDNYLFIVVPVRLKN